MDQKSPLKEDYNILSEEPYEVMAISKEEDQLINKNNNINFRFQIPLHFGESFRGLFKKREVGEFMSGALAGAMTKLVLAPLETIRCRTKMVVGVGPKNITGCFMEIVDQHGWPGLWAGNGVNMLRIIPTQAIELGTFECVKRTVTDGQRRWVESDRPATRIGPLSFHIPFSWVSPDAVAGAAAGIASTLVCHPLEVLKDRLTVDPETYPSIGIAVRKMYGDTGVCGLYAGISPTLVGMIPYSTCYYFMYETMKKSYCSFHNKPSLTRHETLLTAALAGLTASTLSFPLEVARKRLMVGALRGRCPAGMVEAMGEVVREEGLVGLYRGWAASCLKVMPASGITRLFYELWKEVLVYDRRFL